LTPKSAIFNKEQDRKPGKKKTTILTPRFLSRKSDTTLMRVYNYEDLGKRLGDLRPAVAVKNGKEKFSL
jgi:hypothetical protein